tara:strand:+ start:44797 stop:45831 length:1035 start_codon:yes stop_codon:yes gene_type:complete
MEINELIENTILDIYKTKYYSVIIGLSPSRGARSPKLWNAAFSGIGFPGYMYPVDVLPNKLGKLINYLRLDKRFIGGSVAVPYKTNVLKYLDEIEENTRAIGAVNCFYKDSNGKLIGTNTDGLGALWSLKTAYGDLIDAKVLLLGAGGAASAVSSYVGKAIGKNGRLFISNRNKQKSDELIKKLSNVCNVSPVSWPVSYEKTKNIDIIINCTSIGFDNPIKDKNGFYSLKFYSPLGFKKNSIRISQIENLNREYVHKAAKNIAENFFKTKHYLSLHKNLLIFDIIYQPKLTCLLFMGNLIGHNILSGNGMNLEQAVIAFDKTTSATGLRNLNQNEVRKYMKEVI